MEKIIQKIEERKDETNNLFLRLFSFFFLHERLFKKNEHYGVCFIIKNTKSNIKIRLEYCIT